jgi:hypothetical protein
MMKAFTAHGVTFEDDREVGGHRIGVCPFCGRKPGKFYINVTTLCWDCKWCGLSGNLWTFLGLAADRYAKALKGPSLATLAANRGIPGQSLKRWGVGWTGEDYTLPLFGIPGEHTTSIKLLRIGRKSRTTPGTKMSLFAMRGFEVGLSGGDDIYLCEGEWDAIALWTIFQREGVDGRMVLAAPGAGVMPPSSLPLFENKNVFLCYDNDLAGNNGMKHAADKLSGVARSVKKIAWPSGTDDGYDIRDLFKAEGAEAFEKFEGLFPARKRDGKLQKGSAAAADVPNPEKVGETYRRWLSMQSIECLDIMFGTVLGNRLDGDPLWMFLVAPPGGMKTELLMTLSASASVVTTTSMTPQALISGCHFNSGDPSLIPKLIGKVLVVKDFTTILTQPPMDRDSIFGILRDAYDGRTERHFGNGVHRLYEGTFGVLAGVTPIVETISSSSITLGERFLKYRLSSSSGGAGGIHSARAAVRQALANMPNSTQMRAEMQEMATRVLDREVSGFPEVPDAFLERIVDLAQWVALLRGVVGKERYTGIVQFKPMSEIGTRLAKQLSKLACGIALYHQKKVVDPDVYRILTRVATSTIPDRVEDLIKHLFLRGDAVVADLSAWTHLPSSTVHPLMQDLALLKIVRQKEKVWSLGPAIRKLMEKLEIYKHEGRWLKRNVK